MRHRRYSILIPVTFLIAFILTLLPMPAWTIWCRPAWILMILMYWTMTFPYRVNIGTAWIIGIFIDVLNGTLLGEHALALTVVSYLVLRMHSQLRMFPLLQQSLCVLLFTLLYQFILFCVQGFIGELPRTGLYWLSSVTSMLLWPWMVTILWDCQYRFRMT